MPLNQPKSYVLSDEQATTLAALVRVRIAEIELANDNPSVKAEYQAILHKLGDR